MATAVWGQTEWAEVQQLVEARSDSTDRPMVEVDPNLGIHGRRCAWCGTAWVFGEQRVSGSVDGPATAIEGGERGVCGHFRLP
jgi:hypothetical protein